MYDNDFDDFDDLPLHDSHFAEELQFDNLLDDAMLEGLQFDEYQEEEHIMLDVPYVPTDEKIVQALLEMGGVGSRDILYDLGCGDGRILVTAAMQYNTRGIGIDMDPARIADAMEYAGNSRVEHLVDFYEGDLLEADFSEASVVTLYLLDHINLELRPRLQQELRPGSRILSHAFDMGDWKPDQHVKLGGINLFKWIIPARVAGNWHWQSADGTRFSLQLKQKHQKLQGKAQVNGQPKQLISAQLSGDLVEFHIKSQTPNKPHRFLMRYANKQLWPDDKTLQPHPAQQYA